MKESNSDETESNKKCKVTEKNQIHQLIDHNLDIKPVAKKGFIVPS